MLVYFCDCRPLAALMMMGNSSKPMSLFKDKSPVAEHAWKDGDHQINWNDVDIIDRAQGMTERRVKEAIYIGLAPPGLTSNRDVGLELSPIIMRAARGLQSQK